MSIERKIFICECKSLEHLVAFWYDTEDEAIYIEPRLMTHRNFFKRLWVGVKYIFGYKSRFGEFDELILGIDSQKKLRDILNEQKEV